MFAAHRGSAGEGGYGELHLGSRVRDTEISEVATTSTLTLLSRNTLNTCTALPAQPVLLVFHAA